MVPMRDQPLTTEQVRDGFRYDSEAEYHDPITPHHIINGHAFDRWFAPYEAAMAYWQNREAHDAEVREQAEDAAYSAGYVHGHMEGCSDGYTAGFAERERLLDPEYAARQKQLGETLDSLLNVPRKDGSHERPR